MAWSVDLEKLSTVIVAAAAVVTIGLDRISKARETARERLREKTRDAGQDGVMNTQIINLTEALGRLATAEEKLAEAFHAHEISDSAVQTNLAAELRGLRGAVTDMTRANRETHEIMGRRLDNMAAQVARLGPPAGAFSQIIPDPDPRAGLAPADR